MLLIQGICHKFDEEQFLRSHALVDLHYQKAPTAINKVLPYLLFQFLIVLTFSGIKTSSAMTPPNNILPQINYFTPMQTRNLTKPT